MTDPSCKTAFQRVVPPPLIIGDRMWGFARTKREAMQWHIQMASQSSCPGQVQWHLEEAFRNYVWGGKTESPPSLPRRLYLALLRLGIG